MILTIELFYNSLDGRIDPVVTKLSDVRWNFPIISFCYSARNTRLRVCVAAERNGIADSAFVIG